MQKSWKAEGVTKLRHNRSGHKFEFVVGMGSALCNHVVLLLARALAADKIYGFYFRTQAKNVCAQAFALFSLDVHCG